MKKSIISPLMFAALILSMIGSFGNPTVSAQVPQLHTASGDLLTYVQPIAGIWVAEAEYAAIPANARSYQALERLSFFVLNIDPANIRDEEIRIPLTEYCQPELAQYLHFRLAGDRLEYTGASFDDWSFDMTRIDFIHLSYAGEGERLILTLEAMEAETQNYQRVRMVRLPETPGIL